MCGLAGLLTFKSPESGGRLRELASEMADRMLHRGPDSGGVWADPEAGVALSHRRLAIVDLSAEGHQPMASPCGRYVISFNGEIYNFLGLRADLERKGWTFRGGSDTEVLLALMAERGVVSALQAASGMFALAVWDRQERALFLARDRLGKKPLYVGRAGDRIAFASELKAIVDLPGFRRQVDRRSLALFMQRQYVPAPMTIWEDVRKLPAGHVVCLRGERPCPSPGEIEAAMTPFWSLAEIARHGQEEQAAWDDQEALDRLDAELARAVKERMIADVPIGAFLSGGVDSSLVVAMMQAQSSQPVKTFTVAFGETEFNEAEKAREVARHLGTDHVEIAVSPQEAMTVIPQLADIYDEPFADASQIPTWHIARVARQAVTVCLSGDGGDESFAGYGRYILAADLDRRLGRLPAPIARAAGRLARRVPIPVWDRIIGVVRLSTPEGFRGTMSGDRIHKLSALFEEADPDRRYDRLLSMGQAEVCLGPPADWPSPPRANLPENLHRMMLADSLSYLPDDVLTKVDRASMAVSLEVRAPLLDHRVVELAWRMPPSLKLREGRGKWILRQLANRYLPPGLVDGGKAGFGVPVGVWMRGPLREWAEALLEEGRLRQQGLVDAARVRALWSEHVTGRRNWAPALWSILMFEAWLERWQAPPGPRQPTQGAIPDPQRVTV